jgi:hypothetical protein
MYHRKINNCNYYKSRLNQFRSKPISLDKYLDGLKDKLPSRTIPLVKDINESDSASKIVKELCLSFSEEDYLNGSAQRIWEDIGTYYRIANRFNEALNIYLTEYEKIIEVQLSTNQRIHKGSPLCWISDIFLNLGFFVLAKRYIMLTLCEDVISGEGEIIPNNTGVYWRLCWFYGFSDSNIKKNINEIWKNIENKPAYYIFPEWALQNLEDSSWQFEYPNPVESNKYYVNHKYIERLIEDSTEDKTGKTFECLIEYLMSSIPGIRTKRRLITPSTDYDVMCVLEGEFSDFRTEISKYFICEAKNWDKPSDFSTLIKLVGVSEDIASNFGILFSKEGISGKDKNIDGQREILKTFHGKKIIIVVLDSNDIASCISGESLISIIRNNYEKVRLDISSSK